MKELTLEVFLEETHNMFKLLWEENAPNTVEIFLNEMDELSSEITCFLLGKGYLKGDIIFFAENILDKVSDEDCELIVANVAKFLEEKE